MNQGLLKVAEGCELLAAGIREMAAEVENGQPVPKKKEEKAAKEKKDEEKVTVEQIRTVLAEKSRGGKTQEVRAILKEFGADKLSDVPSEKYTELLQKAEEL